MSAHVSLNPISAMAFAASLSAPCRSSLLPSKTPAHSSRSATICLRRAPYRLCSAASESSSPSVPLNYQFRDDGEEVELRVKLPEGHKGVEVSNVAVHVQDVSLDVGLLSPQGISTLLNIPRLYSRIKPVQTIWFIDEDEVVLSMKKLDVAQPWPGLLEAWEFLGKGVFGMLKATSIYIVGESTEINWAVAKEVAVALGYVPLQTKTLIEKVAKTSIDEYAKAEGEGAVAELEGKILANLSSRLRNVVATLGGDQGAAASEYDWRYLYAGFTIWLSQTQAQDESAAEREVIKAKKAATSEYTRAETVVALGGWEDDAARPAAEGCLRALKYLLESDKELPAKKSLYVRLGTRGDWPITMPPGWSSQARPFSI